MSKSLIRTLFGLALVLSPIALIGCGDSSKPSTGTSADGETKAPGKPSENTTKK